MFLLGRAHVPGMSLGSRCPAHGPCMRRLFGSVFLARRWGCRPRVRLGGALGGLLFFFLLFRLFLDSTQFAQDFFALLRRLPSASELNGKYLLDDLVELRASRHPQRFQLTPDLAEPAANGSPFVQVSTN